MCSITPPRNISVAVEQRVDVDLDRVVEEPVDQERGGRAGGRAVRLVERTLHVVGSWASL